MREGPEYQVEGTTRLKAVTERGVKVCVGTEIGQVKVRRMWEAEKGGSQRLNRAGLCWADRL